MTIYRHCHALSFFISIYIDLSVLEIQYNEWFLLYIFIYLCISFECYWIA